MTYALHKDTTNIRRQQVLVGSGMTRNILEQSGLLFSILSLYT